MRHHYIRIYSLRNVQGYFSFNTTGKYTDFHNLMVLIMLLLFLNKHTQLSSICKGKEICRERNLICLSLPSQETKIKMLAAAANFFCIFFRVYNSVSSLTVGCSNKYWRFEDWKITEFTFVSYLLSHKIGGWLKIIWCHQLQK